MRTNLKDMTEDERKEHKRKYLQQYRKNNPEKIRQWNRKSQSAYYNKNVEWFKEYNSNYYASKNEKLETLEKENQELLDKLKQFESK